MIDRVTPATAATAVSAFITRRSAAGGSERANHQLFITELCHLGGLDFAEALHHASYRGCGSMASFDARKFGRRINKLGLPPKMAVPK